MTPQEQDHLVILFYKAAAYPEKKTELYSYITQISKKYHNGADECYKVIKSAVSIFDKATKESD